MRQAPLHVIRLAESMIDGVEARRRSVRPLASTEIVDLRAARALLGSGPRKGPKIEAAWRRVAMKYEATKIMLLRDLEDELALPRDWRSK